MTGFGWGKTKASAKNRFPEGTTERKASATAKTSASASAKASAKARAKAKAKAKATPNAGISPRSVRKKRERSGRDDSAVLTGKALLYVLYVLCARR
jgi:hypothetical protein